MCKSLSLIFLGNIKLPLRTVKCLVVSPQPPMTSNLWRMFVAMQLLTEDCKEGNLKKGNYLMLIFNSYIVSGRSPISL